MGLSRNNEQVKFEVECVKFLTWRECGQFVVVRELSLFEPDTEEFVILLYYCCWNGRANLLRNIPDK